MLETIPKNIANKLSARAKKALEEAEKLSRRTAGKYAGTLHIAYGIAAQKGSAGAAILKMFGIMAKDIEEQIAKAPKNEAQRKQAYSRNFWKALEIALEAAASFKYRYIGTEHLLAGALAAKNSDFEKLLEQKQINPDDARKHIRVIFESSAMIPDILKMFSKPLQEDMKGGKNRRDRAALDAFGTDLTAQALDGNLDMIAGRDREVQKMITILERKNKNNPLLIGDPGVGKTAVVHRLAQKIAGDEVPDELIGKRIVSLDMAALVAGTIFRGEFESRIKEVIEEAEKSDDVILFIDEIHTIVGAGSASGSLDAANILKPALARGDLRCIGATTLEEYKKYIEKDAALERRFQTIIVDEPRPEEAIDMISKIKWNYEKYHGVAISEDAVKAAVEMSARFLTSRKLPDKAIDLIDEASAIAKSGHSSKGKSFVFEIKKLEKAKANLENTKESAISNGNLEEAIIDRNKMQEIDAKLLELNETRKKAEAEEEKIAITPRNIASLIAQNTGIPAEEISGRESIDLAGLERNLKQKITGQDEAVSAIAKAIRRSRAGLAHPSRPIGSFMFLGPTGVGKTELAKTIAEKVFKNPKSLIKIDMSEFTERHTISRLIGAPAGYVGFGEGGQLTEQVKRNPYSVVLFDEIEKAHPDVLNILLQIMEDGKLTDSSGKTISFATSLIIITSNIGTADFTEKAKIGFLGDGIITKSEDKLLEEKYQKIKENTLKALKRQMLPEILNRLNEIIVFKPLDVKAIEKIVKLNLSELVTRLKKQKNISLAISKKIETHLAKLAFSPNQGARIVRSIIQQNIEDPLSEMIISSQIVNGDKVKIDLVKEKIDIKKI